MLAGYLPTLNDCNGRIWKKLKVWDIIFNRTFFLCHDWWPTLIVKFCVFKSLFIFPKLEIKLKEGHWQSLGIIVFSSSMFLKSSEGEMVIWSNKSGPSLHLSFPLWILSSCLVWVFAWHWNHYQVRISLQHFILVREQFGMTEFRL